MEVPELFSIASKPQRATISCLLAARSPTPSVDYNAPKNQDQ